MKRKRTSLFWKISREVLIDITTNSNSIAEIIRKCEMISSGASYKILKQRLIEENIDFSHITLGLSSNKGRKFNREKIPLNKVLVENSNYNRSILKKRLINELGWEDKCFKCNNNGVWQNEKLSIQLDHKNGNSKDNRIENLRFLCPNCHSQTTTFAGKSRLKNKCIVCEKKVSNKHTKHCVDCFTQYVLPTNSFNQRKVERPPKDNILADIKELGYTGTGRKYGVSDNTIRKWLK